MTIQAHALSDIGKVRADNQDSLFVDEGAGLFLVADGMGGMQGGAVASRAVAGTLPKMLLSEVGAATAGPAVTRAVKDAIGALNEWLVKESRGQAALRGMGSTVVLALLRGGKAHVANLGDSRAYLLRKGRLRQLTEDHNIAALMIKLGQLDPVQAQAHPARNRLTRYVGMDGRAVPAVKSVALRRGDVLVLCSDGLTGMVPDAEIAAVIGQTDDLEQACRALIDKANQAGGRDNTTVVLVRT